MNKNEIIQFTSQLINTTEVAYFTTVYEGVPYTRALENLRNEKKFPKASKMFTRHRNDLLVYFSTNTSSTKVKQIQKNPAVSAYYCKPKEYRGVMLGGIIKMITDQNIKEGLWEKGWERYYPEGVKDEDYTVLHLLPKHIRGWKQNQTLVLDLE
ncbi:MAG: pyridoxamine 5'-phosphate oxidase family protein [Candidatus Hodarchaeales archaeon]|jgi:general stress protein 26